MATKRTTGALLALLFVIALPATGAEESIVNRSRGVTKMDKTFAREAAHGLMRDTALALLAQHRASSDKVRTFAAQLHDRREGALARLRRMAHDTRLRMPVALDDHMRQQVDAVGKLRGRAFDERFLQLIADTTYARFFQFELQSGALPVDAQVKRFADEQLAILRKDMARARQLLDGLNQ